MHQLRQVRQGRRGRLQEGLQVPGWDVKCEHPEGPWDKREARIQELEAQLEKAKIDLGRLFGVVETYQTGKLADQGWPSAWNRERERANKLEEQLQNAAERVDRKTYEILQLQAQMERLQKTYQEMANKYLELLEGEKFGRDE